MLKNRLWATAAVMAAVAAAPALAGPVVLPASIGTFTLTEALSATNYSDVTLPVNSYRNDSDGYGDDVFGYTAGDFNGSGPSDDITAIASGSGEVNLKYYFDIAGPVGQTVAIDLSGSVYAFGYPYPDPGDAFAGVYGSLGVPLSGYYADACANFDPSGCPAGANFGTTKFNVKVDIPANTIQWLDLFVQVDGAFYGSEFSAQADPIISIDPSVADPGDYQIEVSPDVVNPVPEPSTWVQLCLGALLAGAALRRKALTPALAQLQARRRT
jgi:hypothetical protein